MANLYLTEQNSILRKSGDRLIIEKDDAVLLEVQCHKIEAVLIFGNVQFTTQVMTSYLKGSAIKEVLRILDQSMQVCLGAEPAV